MQTLQQLKDVYGETSDKTIQGNVSNIIFLKSTDDDMLHTLEGMSGKTHRTYTDGKTVTRDLGKLAMQNEGKMSYNRNTVEEPLIKYTDLAALPERNSVVFRAGKSPVWNRNETILPMSWKLFSNKIQHFGRTYSLQTIPTTSLVKDFDVREYISDFEAMVEKRVQQAMVCQRAKDIYKSAHGYSDQDITRQDEDIYSSEIMGIIDQLLSVGDTESVHGEKMPTNDEAKRTQEGIENVANMMNNAEDNDAMVDEIRAQQLKNEPLIRKRFCEGQLSRQDMGSNGTREMFKKGFLKWMRNNQGMISKHLHDVEVIQGINGTSLSNKTTGEVFVSPRQIADELEMINNATKDPTSRAYASGDIVDSDIQDSDRYVMTTSFFDYFINLDSWDHIGGNFEKTIMKVLFPDTTQ